MCKLLISVQLIQFDSQRVEIKFKPALVLFCVVFLCQKKKEEYHASCIGIGGGYPSSVCVFHHDANYIHEHRCLDWGGWRCSNLPGVIKRVPFSRVGIATVGCVVTAHSGAWVVGHCIQVVHCIYCNRTETKTNLKPAAGPAVWTTSTPTSTPTW